MSSLQLQFRMFISLLLFTSLYSIIVSLVSIVTGVPFILVFVIFTGLYIAAYIYARNSVLEHVNAKEIPKESSPTLYRVTEKVSEMVDTPKPQIMVGDFDGPNGMSMSIRGNGTIIISDELVKIADEDELVAVITHLIVNIKARDSILLLFFQTPLIIIGYFLTERYQEATKLSRFEQVIIKMFSFISFCYLFPLYKYRHKNADRITSEIVGGEALSSILTKISEEHNYKRPLQNPAVLSLYFYNTSGDGFESLISTHPSVQQRIDNYQEE